MRWLTVVTTGTLLTLSVSAFAADVTAAAARLEGDLVGYRRAKVEEQRHARVGRDVVVPVIGGGYDGPE
jgi:hypothetical protein